MDSIFVLSTKWLFWIRLVSGEVADSTKIVQVKWQRFQEAHFALDIKNLR